MGGGGIVSDVVVSRSGLATRQKDQGHTQIVYSAEEVIQRVQRITYQEWETRDGAETRYQGRTEEPDLGGGVRSQQQKSGGALQAGLGVLSSLTRSAGED